MSPIKQSNKTEHIGHAVGANLDTLPSPEKGRIRLNSLEIRKT